MGPIGLVPRSALLDATGTSGSGIVAAAPEFPFVETETLEPLATDDGLAVPLGIRKNAATPITVPRKSEAAILRYSGIPDRFFAIGFGAAGAS